MNKIFLAGRPVRPHSPLCLIAHIMQYLLYIWLIWRWMGRDDRASGKHVLSSTEGPHQAPESAYSDPITTIQSDHPPQRRQTGFCTLQQNGMAHGTPTPESQCWQPPIYTYTANLTITLSPPPWLLQLLLLLTLYRQYITCRTILRL